MQSAQRSPAAPRRTETADSTAATRTRTPTSRRPSAWRASVAVSESDSCSSSSAHSGSPAASMYSSRMRPDSRSSRHSVVGSLVGMRVTRELHEFDVRLAALRARWSCRAGRPCRAAASARPDCAPWAARRRVQLGALHAAMIADAAAQQRATPRCYTRPRNGSRAPHHAADREQRIVATAAAPPAAGRPAAAATNPDRQADRRKAQQRPQRAARRVAGRRRGRAAPAPGADGASTAS